MFWYLEYTKTNCIFTIDNEKSHSSLKMDESTMEEVKYSLPKDSQSFTSNNCNANFQKEQNSDLNAQESMQYEKKKLTQFTKDETLSYEQQNAYTLSEISSTNQNHKRRRLSETFEETNNSHIVDSSSSSLIYDAQQSSIALHKDPPKVVESSSSPSMNSPQIAECTSKSQFSDSGEDQNSRLSPQPSKEATPSITVQISETKNHEKKKRRFSPAGKLICDEDLDDKVLSLGNKNKDEEPVILSGSLPVNAPEINNDTKESTSKEKVEKAEVKKEESTRSKRPNRGRWRAHQMAEDYITLAGNIMYPNIQFSGFGYHPLQNQYPLEHPTTLGLLTHPIRRPTVIETWSPYEIAMFEAALCIHGKQFHTVQKIVGSKNTKEIIAFYYIWKKTSHYKKWKSQHNLDRESSDEESDDEVPAKATLGRPSGRGSGLGRGAGRGSGRGPGRGRGKNK